MDTRPSSDFHSGPIKAFNDAARAAHGDGPVPEDLLEERLLSCAIKETGLNDFGGDGFLQGMRVLLASLESEARLTPFGRHYARSEILKPLKNRLWAERCFESHAEILDREIEAPVIILGLHRSGTTRLHRMLAADARFRFLATWEGFNPAPRIGSPDQGQSERYGEVDAVLSQLDIVYPGFRNAHPMSAALPEEEILLLRHSFCSPSQFFPYHNPSYYEWFKGKDQTSDYEYMKKLMKLLSWLTNDPPEKRWLMKNPTHMMQLDVLMRVFPDAKLIFLHRDPVKTAASLMSLRWLGAVQLTDQPLRAVVRDASLDLCETMARRCMERRSVGVPKNQWIDIHYDEMSRDWRSVARRVYDFSGLEFTPEAETSLETWLLDVESENLHGAHRYALEDFGAIPEEVDERMAFYRTWMSIERETRAGQSR